MEVLVERVENDPDDVTISDSYHSSGIKLWPQMLLRCVHDLLQQSRAIFAVESGLGSQ